MNCIIHCNYDKTFCREFGAQWNENRFVFVIFTFLRHQLSFPLQRQHKLPMSSISISSCTGHSSECTWSTLRKLEWYSTIFQRQGSKASLLPINGVPYGLVMSQLCSFLLYKISFDHLWTSNSSFSLPGSCMQIEQHKRSTFLV